MSLEPSCNGKATPLDAEVLRRCRDGLLSVGVTDKAQLLREGTDEPIRFELHLSASKYLLPISGRIEAEGPRGPAAGGMGNKRAMPAYAVTGKRAVSGERGCVHLLLVSQHRDAAASIGPHVDHSAHGHAIARILRRSS